MHPGPGVLPLGLHQLLVHPLVLLDLVVLDLLLFVLGTQELEVLLLLLESIKRLVVLDLGTKTVFII